MLVEIDMADGVATLTLNRPERRNALGTAVMAAFDHALSAALTNPAVGAILVRGAAPGFCAGSDLKELAGLDAGQMAGHEAETARIVLRLGGAPKAVVVAVKGYALGGGLALATACDIVVSSATARWHMPEVANGWIPPWGFASLINRLGRMRAMQLLWAEPMDGHEAKNFGLVDHVASDESCDEVAMTIARRLAALPRAAMSSTKRFFAMTGAEALDAEASNLFIADCASPEAMATFARFGARR